MKPNNIKLFNNSNLSVNKKTTQKIIDLILSVMLL